MKKTLTLEIEKGIEGRASRVGVSKEITIADGKGSNVSGSVSLIPGCDSYQQLAKEVAAIQGELDTLLEESKGLFKGQGGTEEAPEVDESKSGEEIWDLLAKIEDPKLLSARFNSMSYEKRIEVADHVLAHCNVFTGPASMFSMRYNSEEGLLE
ncbi:MAG: hypothetical protein DRG87_07700 [Deltaproteobacteria bacterium]|nr:hypothetical protein [Deltaproteobacteria bacterium]RLB29191.1 MAG: hypothetical protein DRG87_07700 [Deltaproteobacteria bacterium]